MVWLFEKLDDMSLQDLKTAVGNHVKTYQNDLDSNLEDEVTQLKFLRTLYNKKNEDESTAMHLYRIIKENKLQSTFPNTEIALRMYLSIMAINCTSERSLSKMEIKIG